MKKKLRLGRVLIIGFILVIFLVLAGFGLSNLYLMSPKGRSFLGDRATRTCGLPTTVEGASWSPWNGVSVYGIRIEQPEPLRNEIERPLVQIRSIRISPAWQELRNRRLVFRSIEVEGPKFSVPIEIVANLSSSTDEQDQPPLLSKNDVENKHPIDIPQHSPDLGEKPEVAEAPEQPPIVHQAEIRSIPQVELLTTWINVSEAEFQLISTFSEQPIYEIKGINGSIPIGGNPAESGISIKSLKCMGTSIVENTEVPVNWKRPLLKFGPYDAEFSDIGCHFGASISFTNHFPAQLSFALPEQAVDHLEIGNKGNVSMETLAGQGRLQGLIMIPQTWQGQAIIQCANMSARYESNEMQFDQGRAFVVFRNGSLSCLDARIIGDSASLLGNATLLSDGRMAAAARIVSAPEYLVAVSNSLRSDRKAPNLTSLSTPQRAALDMQVFGRLGQPLFYLPDPKSEPLALGAAISRD